MQEQERIAAAAHLEKVAILIKLAARAVRAGGTKTAAHEAQAAIEALARYLDTGDVTA